MQSGWLEKNRERVRYVVSSPRDAVRLLRATVSNRARRALERAIPRARVRCNLCGWSGRRFEYFLERHFVVRESQCPGCGSQPRHRALMQHVMARARPGMRFLDVAPAPAYRRHLVDAGLQYLGVDVTAHRRVDARMDLTRLALSDASMDLILCSHVLEHVPEDTAALREMHRVLRPGGVAFIDVPRRTRGATVPISPPDHQGHVWDFGGDVAPRLAAAGFEVTDVPYGSMAPGESFFLCRKG